MNESLVQIKSGVDPLDTEVGKILTEEGEISGALSAKQKGSLLGEIGIMLTNTANAANALGGGEKDPAEGTVGQYVEELNDKIEYEDDEK
jgi:hypothetical protein